MNPAEQAQVLETSVNDAIRGTEIASVEFKAGTGDYTTVAAAQESQFSLQQSALLVQESRLVDAASLIGDLGGGWSAGSGMIWFGRGRCRRNRRHEGVPKVGARPGEEELQNVVAKRNPEGSKKLIWFAISGARS